jgi:hypothetical protein
VALASDEELLLEAQQPEKIKAEVKSAKVLDGTPLRVTESLLTPEPEAQEMARPVSRLCPEFP